MISNIDLKNLLKELLDLGKETEWVEFKHNNGNPEEIGEYCSALSNSAALLDQSYGFIVFGVKNDDHSVVGTSFLPSKEMVGNHEFENWLATQIDPRVDFRFHEFSCDGKDISIIQIDCAKTKPVSFKGNEYIRVGSYKKKLKEHPDKERKLWLKFSLDSFETRVAEDNLNADDVLRVLDYPKYFELTNTVLPSTKELILKRFEEECLIKKRVDGSWQVLNLGAILFAKNLSEFSRLKRKAVRVIKYKGVNNIQTIKEMEFTSGYATSFAILVRYINDQLPANEHIGEALRKEVKVYPEIAIRELSANTLIHQDFDVTGTGPTIEIFTDRIEFSNPGKPLISALRFIDFKPTSRNENLAAFMRRIGICEERGSGIDKVINAVEVFQLPAPRFVEEESFFKTILYSSKSLRQMNREDKVRACYQHCCLKHVSNSVMTNESLRGRFKIEEKNYSIASRIISDALEDELIKFSNPNSKSKKMASYIPFWA